MGFKADLLLLYSEKLSLRTEDNEKTVYAWKGYETISLGRVTRLEKLIDHPEFGFPPRMVAGICTAQYILKKLWAKLPAANRADFAPPILIYDLFPREALPSNQDLEGYFVDCGPRGEYSSGLSKTPSKEGIGHHNRILSLDQKGFGDYVANRYGIVRDDLFMWETASTVAAWLNEMETANSEEWIELKKEPLSLSLTRARRAYLEEIGMSGARLLFLFY